MGKRNPRNSRLGVFNSRNTPSRNNPKVLPAERGWYQSLWNIPRENKRNWRSIVLELRQESVDSKKRFIVKKLMPLASKRPIPIKIGTWEARQVARACLGPLVSGPIKAGHSSQVMRCKMCNKWEVASLGTPSVICTSCCDAMAGAAVSKRMWGYGKYSKIRKRREKAMKEGRKGWKKRRRYGA